MMLLDDPNEGSLMVSGKTGPVNTWTAIFPG